MQQLESPTAAAAAGTTIPATTDEATYPDDMDSDCSTPYVSAPSSPAHGPLSLSGYYYSAPASPIHFILSTTHTSRPDPSPNSTFEFDFSANLTTTAAGGTAASPGGGPTAAMSSADELFYNGQIRPMTLSTHLHRPETPENETHDWYPSRGRDDNPRDKSSVRNRRTRSLSPLRTPSFEFQQHSENEEVIIVQNDDDVEKEMSLETTPSGSGSVSGSGSGPGSRSSSVGRGSNRWVFLKEFLYRSKSEGRNSSNGNKFWTGLSFSSPMKDKKVEKLKVPRSKVTSSGSGSGQNCRLVSETGVLRKRRVPAPSAHEVHYTANRAVAEEMRKRTYLPYRQGLLGCLGFSSKSYGAWNGFTRALNPVSSK